VALALIDAHHHFQDLRNHRYPRLDADAPEKLEGDLSPIRRDYLAADHARDVAGVELVASVHVQNGWDPTDPIGETHWLEAQAEGTGRPDAIVAYADLASPGVGDLLAAHAAHPRVRGIRQILNWHSDPRYRVVTPSAVTQQIQSLELQLGVSLLAKAGRRIVLTEAGERYFSMITSEIERISDATGTIRGFRSVTTLVIRATPTLSNKWLLPRLSRFLDAEPNLEVRPDGTNEPTDFNRELVDLEIRHGDGRWPGLFVEGLSEEAFVPACAPGMAQAGSLTAADLPRFRLIHSVKSQAQWGRAPNSYDR
jgi:hypothetical protein